MYKGKKEEAQQFVKEEESPDKNKLFLMAEKAVQRREKQIAEQLSAKSFLPSQYTGSIPLLHPIYHKFRDEEPLKFMGKKTMMNFSQLSHLERAKQEQSEHRAHFLSAAEPTPRCEQPDFRPTDAAKLMQPRFQSRPSHDAERVQNAIASNPGLNVEKLDTKMLYFHDFRPSNRSKWLSPKDLLAWERNRGRSWERIENYSAVPYNGGYDEAILIRKRDPAKEISPIRFSSVIPQDAWKNRIFQDQSIRMFKSLELQYASAENAKNKEKSITDKSQSIKQILKPPRTFFSSQCKMYKEEPNRELDRLNAKKVYFQSLYGFFPKHSCKSSPTKTPLSKVRSVSSMRNSPTQNKGKPQEIAAIVQRYLY